jgi:dTDP-4-amino-4,6-dideoxygalactose transaminase
MTSRPASRRSARSIPLFLPSLPAFDSFRAELESVAASGIYTNFGPALARFRRLLAERLDVSPARLVVVTNATIGLALSLMAITGKPGRLCLLPAWTHVATAAAVRLAGLVPWFVDVDADTWHLDPTAVRAHLAAAPGPVAAIVVVSAFGAPIDLESWQGMQDACGIPVIVDAAAGFDGWRPSGVTSVVSFHATKAFGIGEGGAVLAADDAGGEHIRELCNLGIDGDRVAKFVGLNAKMDEFRAAIGIAALREWPANRAAIMARTADYERRLADAGVRYRRPAGIAGIATSTFSLWLPDVESDAMVGALEAQGVGARRWWGAGCHRTPAYADYPRTAMATTDMLARGAIGLPLYPMLTADDVADVVDALCRALADARRPSRRAGNTASL